MSQGTTPVPLVIAGAGLVGKQHINAISQTNEAQLAAIVDPETSAKALALQHGVQYYESLDALFQNERPEGLVLATPTPQHIAQGLQCVEAGCAMLVEKPISDHAENAVTLIKAAQQAKVPLLTGHHRRHNPIIAKAKSLIVEGALGQIRSAQSNCWLYKPDDYFQQAPWRTQKGAGPISVNLVHDIDLLRYLVGEVSSVQAQATPSARGFENEDLASALLKFDNGALATVTVSDSIVAPWSWELTANENPAYPVTNQHSMVIGGSDASLSIPDLQLWSHPGMKSWNADITATSFVTPNAQPLVCQIEHFARVIREEEEPLVSGLEGMKSLQVVEAIQNAAITGTTVQLQNLL